MPNFHFHWLVAINAINEAPDDVQAGYKAYSNATGRYRADLLKVLQDKSIPNDEKKIGAQLKIRHERWLKSVGMRRLNDPLPWYRRIGKDIDDDAIYENVRDDVTCFSAYMLGATGPDFWTTLSKNWPLQIIPDFATTQFDLGHYNRTTRQFQASVHSIGARTDLQARVQRAYFCGMSAHIATDLVVHQLVNVSAGSYNLLDKIWLHETVPGQIDKMKKWHTHNKIEHYWDTYVRYRFLGDWGPVFQEPADKEWFNPLGFPLVDTLIRVVKEERTGAIRDTIVKVLSKNKTKFLIEKPFTFPWAFCDRVTLNRGVQPFLHDVAIRQAYPEDEIHSGLAAERTTPQMVDSVSDGYSERTKLQYFASDGNDDGDGSTTFNYLTYYVCPNLAQVQQSGNGVFYDLAPLEPFALCATDVTRRFLTDLQNAYRAADSSPLPAMDQVGLGALGEFWNLDTGLALRVERIRSKTSNEVITLLSFMSVFEISGLGIFELPPEKVPAVAGAGYLSNKSSIAYPSAKPACAFELRPPPEQPFDSLSAISESDDKAYFAWLSVKDDDQPKPTTFLTPETFFTAKDEGASQSVSCPTDSRASGPTKVCVEQLKHRVNLWLRATMPTFGMKDEDLGFFVHADSKAGADPVEFSETLIFGPDEAAADWLKKDSKVINYGQKPAPGPSSSLRRFEARLFANLETEKNLTREVAAGKWNNVIAQNNDAWVRNFAIGLARRYVLHWTAPAGSTFAPASHFVSYSDPSPTENVHFTLYALVKTKDGCFDIFTKKPVEEDKHDEIRRINAAGVVKIVLYYVLKNGVGGVQLDECYVDGLKIPMKERFLDS